MSAGAPAPAAGDGERSLMAEMATILSRLRPRVEMVAELAMRAADEISRTRGFSREPLKERPG